ncbi:MAG: hypothetical protein JWP04_272 [Belnapia sp.]|nr:hypothetical protein [Belnapia sp.]
MDTGSVVAPTLAAIEALHGTVLMARALVSTGRRVDLAGLDTEAACLCAAVAILPPATARSLRPALESLARDVDGLAAMLPSP